MNTEKQHSLYERLGMDIAEAHKHAFELFNTNDSLLNPQITSLAKLILEKLYLADEHLKDRSLHERLSLDIAEAYKGVDQLLRSIDTLHNQQATILATRILGHLKLANGHLHEMSNAESRNRPLRQQ